MPAITAPSQVGVREDLSDAIILADVRNTPLLSRMKKGEKLKNMLFSWQVDKYGNRRAGGVPDNKDVDAFEDDRRTRLYGRGERFWRTPRVGVIAEKVNEVAGVSSEYNRQVTKKTKEQARDIEAELVSDQESQDDDGVNGAKFRGAGRFVNDAVSVGAGGAALTFTDTPTAIPTDYRTPTNQIYVGSLAAFDETQALAMMQARYDAQGGSPELSMFAGSALKSQISVNFGKYVPNKSNYTVAVRTIAAAIDAKKFYGYGIDIYEGDFGTFDITLEPFMCTTSSPFVAAPRKGYLLAMDQVELRPFMYCDHTELPYLGGGISGLIDSILGPVWGNPLAHSKVDPASA